MKKTGWEEGSRVKWDQEQKRSRKNEIKKWSVKENWDQENKRLEEKRHRDKKEKKKKKRKK